MVFLRAGTVPVLCPVRNCGCYVQLSFQRQFEVLELWVLFYRIEE